MKYVLVEVDERDILTPECFDSIELAREKMFSGVANIMGYTTNEIKDIYESGEDTSGDYFGVFSDYAYAERHGNNFDWRIFKLENGELL